MWVWFAASAALAGECESPAKAEQVGGHVEDAMLAYATLDEDGFRASATLAESSLPCVEDLFSPSRAAAYHRMKGLHLFLDGDPANAQKSFAAALSIEPDYKLSAKIAPEGGKLWRMYDGAAIIPREAPAAFEAPRGTKSYVDGAPASVRVPDFPAIVQIAAGTVASTTVYVAGGEALPAFSAGAVAVVEEPLDAPLDEPVTPDKPPKEPREKSEKPEKGGAGKWVGVAIGAGVAGGLFATSAASRMAFDNNPSAGTYYVTNGAYFGSIGAAAVTVGLAGLAIGGTF